MNYKLLEHRTTLLRACLTHNYSDCSPAANAELFQTSDVAPYPCICPDSWRMSTSTQWSGFRELESETLACFIYLRNRKSITNSGRKFQSAAYLSVQRFSARKCGRIFYQVWDLLAELMSCARRIREGVRDPVLVNWCQLVEPAMIYMHAESCGTNWCQLVQCESQSTWNLISIQYEARLEGPRSILINYFKSFWCLSCYESDSPIFYPLKNDRRT